MEEVQKFYHCVGGYASCASMNECTVLIFRNEEQSDTMLYMIELCEGTVRQLWGPAAAIQSLM